MRYRRETGHKHSALPINPSQTQKSIILAPPTYITTIIAFHATFPWFEAFRRQVARYISTPAVTNSKRLHISPRLIVTVTVARPVKASHVWARLKCLFA
jgi:hypothetical protein